VMLSKRTSSWGEGRSLCRATHQTKKRFNGCWLASLLTKT